MHRMLAPRALTWRTVFTLVTIAMFVAFLPSIFLVLSRGPEHVFSSIMEMHTTNSVPRFVFPHRKPLRSFNHVISLDTDLPQADTLTQIANLAKVRDVDCRAVIQGQENATQHTLKVARGRRKPLDSVFYITATKDCTKFQESRGYIMSSLTKEEETFPIAYSILAYKEPEMVERLLRVIYRPQNFYCIHVDHKVSEDFYKAFDGIVGCFPNVFLASRRIDVQWGWFSVLEADLACMNDLWKYKTWRYFINLTGQEFPLKTNYELVKILKAYRGANDVHGTVINANHERWNMTGPPPHGIQAFKGSVKVVVSREFVDYALHNQTAKDLMNWTMGTKIPDETYFATLNHNAQLGIKGSYTKDPDVFSDFDGKPTFTRYVGWGDIRFCAGWKWVRGVCILSTGDLKRLCRSLMMFANKFYFDQDPVAIECLEEWLFNNTRDEYMNVTKFDASFYASQDFVINQVR